MRTKKGIVTSAKMTGTVTVTVHSHAYHALYKKRFRRSKKFLADTGGLDLYEGDTVLITECRPLSKRKCFRVSEIIVKAARVSELQEEAALTAVTHFEKKPGAKQETAEAEAPKKGTPQKTSSHSKKK